MCLGGSLAGARWQARAHCKISLAVVSVKAAAAAAVKQRAVRDVFVAALLLATRLEHGGAYVTTVRAPPSGRNAASQLHTNPRPDETSNDCLGIIQELSERGRPVWQRRQSRGIASARTKACLHNCMHAWAHDDDFPFVEGANAGAHDSPRASNAQAPTAGPHEKKPLRRCGSLLRQMLIQPRPQTELPVSLAIACG